jgi:hypothetical protein
MFASHRQFRQGDGRVFVSAGLPWGIDWPGVGAGFAFSRPLFDGVVATYQWMVGPPELTGNSMQLAIVKNSERYKLQTMLSVRAHHFACGSPNPLSAQALSVFPLRLFVSSDPWSMLILGVC